DCSCRVHFPGRQPGGTRPGPSHRPPPHLAHADTSTRAGLPRRRSLARPLCKTSIEPWHNRLARPRRSETCSRCFLRRCRCHVLRLCSTRRELRCHSSARPILPPQSSQVGFRPRSEEHTSEPSHDQISYAVFCLKKKIERR